MRKIKYRVFYDLSDTELPKVHELRVAKILAGYFQSDIAFIRKGVGVSPDIRIEKTHQVWELKSPLGNGKRTIDNNLREAAHQSKCVVLDLTRCKMNNQMALSKVNGFMNSGDAHIKKLLIIDKENKVIDFFAKKR